MTKGRAALSGRGWLVAERNSRSLHSAALRSG
jgi:hypothetical protein